MAFDLVARLKLQDEFTDKLKRVVSQLDKMKAQVGNASKITGDMGNKFSKVGIVATASIGKVGDGAINMSSKIEKASAKSSNSMNLIGKSTDSISEGVGKASSGFSQSLGDMVKSSNSLKDSVAKTGSESSRSLDGIGESANKGIHILIGASTQAATSIKGIGTSSDSMKSMLENASSSSGAALSSLGDNASVMSKKISSSAKLSESALDKISRASGRVVGEIPKIGEKSKHVFGIAGRAMNTYKSGMDKLKSSNSLFARSTDKLKSTFDKLKSAGKNSMESIKNSVTQLPSKFSSVAGKIKNSLSSGIRGPAISAKNAIIGIGSAVGAIAVVSKAFNMLKGSIDSAVKRYDTLNNFPKIMQGMGFSAEDSKKSIDRLAEGIDGLPTALDDIATTAQRIATSSGDLSKATETAIALNNALLASGSDAEKASRGTEQYLKSLSTGKMEMDSWTTLQETMGLGLNEIAKAFGLTGDQLQNQLYKKLKDGKITMEEFNKKLIELSDKTGGLGDLAKDATGGLATAWGNMKIAIAKGLTDTIEATDKALGGTGKIADIIMSIKDKIKEAFKTANTYVLPFVKSLKRVYDATKSIHPMLKEVAKVMVIFGIALGGLAIGAGIIAGLSATFTLLATPMTLIVLGISALATAFVVAYKKVEPFRKSVDQVVDGVKGFLSLVKGNEGKGASLLMSMGIDKETYFKIKQFADGIRDAGKKLSDAKSMISGFFDTFKNGSTAEGLKGMLEDGLDLKQVKKVYEFSNSAREAFGQLKDAFGEVRTYFAEKAAELSPTLDRLGEAFTVGKDAVVEVFKTLWSLVGPILSLLKTALMIVAEVVVIAWTNIIVPALEWAMTAFKTLWKIVGPILTLFGAAIELAGVMIGNMWNLYLKPFVVYLTKNFAAVMESSKEYLEKLGAGFDSVGGFITTITGYVKTFADALRNVTIPDWVKTIGGKLKGAAEWAGRIAFDGGPGVQDAGKGHYHGISYVPRDGYCIAA